MSRILVIGGHGKVARLLSPLLVAQGHQVTALFRNPDHLGDVASDGAVPVVFDIERADTDAIAAQMQEHDAIVWSAGAGGGSPERTYAVDRDAAIRSMDAAQHASVQRYLMVSYIGASHDQGVGPDDPFYPYAQAKAAADAYLRGTKLAWTILGPGKLTLEPPSGRIAVDPGLEHAPTSRGNVARVIVAALAKPSTIGRTIDFVDGNEPIEHALGG